MAGSYLEDVLGGNAAADPLASAQPVAPSTSYLEDLETQSRERARLAINHYRSTTSDDAARAAMQSARAPEVLGQPVPSGVFLNEGQVTAAFRKAEAEKRVADLNPRLASWATKDPVNAVMVREYGEELGFLGQAAEALTAGAQRMGVGIESFLFGGMAKERKLAQLEQTRRDQQRKPGEPLEGEQGPDLNTFGGRFEAATDLIRDTFDPTRRLREGLRRERMALTPVTDGQIERARNEATDAFLDEMVAKNQIENDYKRGQRVSAVDKRLAIIEQDATLGTWERFGAQMSALMENPLDGAAWLGTVTLESAPAMVAGAATTLITRSPAAGATVAGMGSATVSYGPMYEKIAKDAGFDLRTKEGIAGFMKTPAAREIVRDQAGAYALTIGVVDTLSGGVAGTQLMKTPAGELLAQGLVQAVMGSGGEALALLAAEQELDPFEIAIEGLAELVTVPVEVFGVGGQMLNARRRQMQETKTAQGFFEALAGNAENSELKAKLPEKYKEAVAELTKGGPVETVQIDASGLDQLLQSGRLTVEDVAKATGISAEQIAMTISEGGDLSLQTADYAANIAGTDLDKALREHMRINGSATAAEIAASQDRDSAVMKDLDAAIKEVEAGTKRLTQTLETARTQLVEELQAAGRAPGVASAEATQLVVFAEVMAKRLNMPVEDFLAENPLPRVFRPEGEITEVAVDDLTTLRAAGGQEAAAIEAAAAAAGLTEDATNEELADALRTFAGMGALSTPDAEGAPARVAAREALSRTLNQPSIDKLGAPLRVIPTGGKKGETITNQDIARAFVDDVLAREGRRLDPLNDMDDRAKMIADMKAELMHQIGDSGDSGFQWYVEDVAAAMAATVDVLPELKDDPVRQQLFLAVAALLSPQNNPVNNWEDAVQAFSTYLRTGEFVDQRPTRRALSKEELKKGVKPGPAGRQLVPSKYGVSSKTTLPMLTYLVKQRGEVGALEWLMTKHTVQELSEFRRATGIFLGGDQTRKWQDFMPADKLVSDPPDRGMSVFGPKVSDFMLNATGLDADAVTVDLWLMRTFGRHRGTLMDASPKLLEEGGIYDQPTRADRQVLDAMITQIARDMGRTPSSIQALLWYYEQKLWRAHGAKADSRNFKQGADVAASKRGFNGDDLDGRGAGLGDQGNAQVFARSESPVTEDDLFSVLTPDFFGRPGWVTLTADDFSLPEAGRREANRAREAELVADLDARGIPYRRLTGFYGTPEPERSFLILADEATAKELGAKYNQDSVLTRDGLIYTTGADRDPTPLNNTILTGRAAMASGFFSRDDSGYAFSLGFGEAPVVGGAYAQEQAVELNQAPLTYTLPGLEKASPGPVAGVRELASKYMKSVGLPVRHQAEYVTVDVERAKRIAELYDQTPDAPTDPEVRAAYDALAKETIAQYQALKELGFTFDWIEGDDPYSSPADAIRDMQENKHLWVFPTTSGFGTVNVASDQNALLQLTDEVVSGRQTMVNDLFRIVHDVFGHGSEGASFGPRGEENAWQAHVRMFTPLAARAMTSETRGQNSWVNYGPFGEQNRKDPKNTVYADQKTILLPEWVSTVGQVDDMPLDANGNPAPAAVIPATSLPRGTQLFQSERETDAFKAWFGDSKVVDADGNPLVVMHATLEGGFQEFRVDGEGKTAGTGAFFTNDLSMAVSYSGSKREIAKPLTVEQRIDMGLITIYPPNEENPNWTAFDEDEEEYAADTRERLIQDLSWLDDAPDGKQPGIYYTYLSLQDPLVIDAGGANWAQIMVNDVYVAFNADEDVIGYGDDAELLAEEFPGETGMRIEKVTPDSHWSVLSRVPDWLTMTTDQIARMGREMGADGVIIKNVADFGPYGRGGEVGDVYVAFKPTQVKSIHNAGTFKPRDPNIYRQSKRGSIILPPTGSGRAPIVNLFQTADLSTVLHESGHYFLYTFQRLIQGGKATPEIVADYEALKGWWAKNAEAVAKDAGGPVTPAMVELYLKKGTAGDPVVDQAIYVGMHEQFARAYEAYLFEGKSPSSALSRLFDTFSSWLLSVYRKVARLDVKIDDDIRAVFDRMLATDEEIAKAKAKENRPELIAKTAKELGITDEEYAELVKLSAEAQDEARRTLLAEVMAPMQAQLRAEKTARKAALRDEVTREVRRKPIHRVIQWLGNERWLGEDAPVQLPADLRIDRQQLIDTYGAGITTELPRGKRPIWKEGSGVSADDVAMWFGFASGDAMIQALKAAPTLDAEIEATLNARLAAETPDPMVDGTIPEKALNALQGAKRGDLIAAELKALGRRASKSIPRTTLSAAREAARRKIATLPIRQAVAYDGYRQSAARAADRAQQALAKGDVDLAYEEKRKEMLNHALFMEARDAAAEVEKLERKVARLKKPGTRKNIDGEYLAAIDEVLDRYDFRKLTQSAERRRGALKAYVEMMEKAGRANELSIPQKVLDETQRRPYKTLPYNEVRGIADTLANIEHTGRRKKSLIDAKRQRDLDAAVAEVVTEAALHMKASPVPRTRAQESGIRNTLRAYANLLLNADTLLRELGGWSMGKAYDLIKTPIDEAANTAQTMRAAAAERIEQIYSVYDKDEMKRMGVRRDHPALKTRGDKVAQFTHWDIISMALNMGNEDNLARLMDKDNGFGYTQGQVDYIKGQLSDKDWDFVESVWAHINEYWPLIAEREKRQTGVVPPKVEGVDFVLPSGRTIKGAYYPIKYDARIREAVSAEQIAELQLNMMSGKFGKAQTRHGHTKERSGGSGGRVLTLGMEAYHQHIGQVIHDLAYSEAVNNAWRVLQHPDMVALFERNGRSADKQALELWVQDAATGTQVAGGLLGSFAVKLKNSFTLSKLAFNLSSVLIQFTGVAQSMVVVGKLPFLKAMHEYATNRARWVEIVKARSPFMAERETTFHKDILDMQNEVTRTPFEGKLAGAQQAIGLYGFWMMTKVQFYGIDMPTWIAGYNNALAAGKTDAEAIHEADRMVARAQASGLQSDRSAFERGTLSRDTRQQGFVRLFTALGSYMFAKGNIAYERIRKGGAEIDGFNVKSMVSAFSTTADLALLFTLEAVLYNAIKGTLPGMGDDDEDEDGWAEFLAKETGLSILSTMPILRDAGSMLSGFEPGGAYGSAMDTILGKPMVQIGQGEVDAALLKAVSNAIGAVTGLPSAQGNRIIDGLFRMYEGEDVAPIEFIMGRRE